MLSKFLLFLGWRYKIEQSRSSLSSAFVPTRTTKTIFKDTTINKTVHNKWVPRSRTCAFSIELYWCWFRSVFFPPSFTTSENRAVFEVVGCHWQNKDNKKSTFIFSSSACPCSINSVLRTSISTSISTYPSLPVLRWKIPVDGMFNGYVLYIRTGDRQRIRLIHSFLVKSEEQKSTTYSKWKKSLLSDQ